MPVMSKTSCRVARDADLGFHAVNQKLLRAHSFVAHRAAPTSVRRSFLTQETNVQTGSLEESACPQVAAYVSALGFQAIVESSLGVPVGFDTNNDLQPVSLECDVMLGPAKKSQPNQESILAPPSLASIQTILSLQYSMRGQVVRCC